MCLKDSYFGCYFCSDIPHQQKNLRLYSESAQFHPRLTEGEISKKAASGIRFSITHMFEKQLPQPRTIAVTNTF